MKTKELTTKSMQFRKRAVSAALVSLKAEGLIPSTEAQSRLGMYANGNLTAEQVRLQTLSSVKRILKVA
jgi:hypothetical protein